MNFTVVKKDGVKVQNIINITIMDEVITYHAVNKIHRDSLYDTLVIIKNTKSEDENITDTLSIIFGIIKMFEKEGKIKRIKNTDDFLKSINEGNLSSNNVSMSKVKNKYDLVL